ncbi:hypothetical protein PQR05_15800 [Paraburkholderia sediminicola]|uniref:Uncharacterized protein n=1 Tax=Paraburkholderia metrosideri TaxID=580937 RepID=A0ABW9DSN2_9BURK
MTRPLALIEGDLTIPLPRPFDGLPPPFGSRHRVLRQAVHHAVSEIAKLPRASMFPPGVKHVLFYKAPPQRVDTHSFDAAVAEAKRYLQMDTARACSSRSDHLLAGAIFAGCTIALTWLLVTCSMKDAEKAKKPSVTPVVAAWQAEIAGGKAAAPTVAAAASAAPATSVNADAPAKAQSAHVAAAESAGAPTQVAQTVPLPPTAPKQDAQAKPVSPVVSARATQVVSVSPVVPAQAMQVVSASPAVPKQDTQAASPPYVATKQVARASSIVPKQTVQITSRNDSTATPTEKTVKRVKVARLSEAHVNERMALSRATRPASTPAASKQPEWTAGVTHNDVSTDDASWMNWAAQQHRPAPTMRASVPSDTNWNARMTQRRITDNPDAFK